MDIGNTRLSGEECSRCFTNVQHVAEAHGMVITEPVQYAAEGCAECERQSTHLHMATETRRRHHDDAERVWEEEMVVTADMMRVTMLPIRLLKGCIFTPRVSVLMRHLRSPRRKTESEGGSVANRIANVTAVSFGMRG